MKKLYVFLVVTNAWSRPPLDFALEDESYHVDDPEDSIVTTMVVMIK